LFATELNSAALVVGVVINIDVRELAAELEAVPAPQIRDAVLKIGNRVLELRGTAAPTTMGAKPWISTFGNPPTLVTPVLRG